jgi:hypothetical protein
VNVTFTISFKLADYNTDVISLADTKKRFEFAERSAGLLALAAMRRTIPLIIGR